MPAAVTAVIVSDDPQNYEDEHVHSVYDEIAPHFSSTRYKPWPIIAQFLSSLPTGWVGLDSGTGNGKYLPLPLDRPGSVWTVGLDRSRNLLEIAQKAGDVRREVVLGDVLGRPWRAGAFDYAISIATIHHLSTHERRREAVQRLIESISALHGRALIYVWAIEQDELSKRNIPSTRQAESPDEQNGASMQGEDVFVPWVLSSQLSTKQNKARASQDTATTSDKSMSVSPEKVGLKVTRGGQSQVFNRYYHMFAHGELQQLVHEAATQLGLVVGCSPVGDNIPDVTTEDDMAGGAGGIEIIQDGWERSNYYVELRRWKR